LNSTTQIATPKNTTQKAAGWILTAEDRCDTGNCGAQAYVKVTGVTGSLYFCSHHYNLITDNAVGYDKLERFAYEIIDERAQLVENRLMGSD
jgi:hypothetical protein